MSTESELCRNRAALASDEAEVATLSNVRDRALRAAAAWNEMAERAERHDQLRAARAAEGKPPLG